MKQKYDVIVVGMGIAGLGCAIPLAKAGRKVLLLGKRGVRGEATQASAGILDPMLEMKSGSPLLKMNLKAFARYPFFIQDLVRQTHSNVDYVKTGMVYAAQSQAEEKILAKRFHWQKKVGMPVRWLARKQLLKLHPYLTPQGRAALFYPTIAKVNPKKLRLALLKLARRLGVKFRNYSGDLSISSDKNRITGIRFGKITFPSPVVINATGGWAGKHSFLKMRLPVLPVRGQILILKDKIKIPTIVHSLDGTYIVPWENRQYLVGSTVERVGFKPSVTVSGIRDIQTRAEKIVPALRSFKRITSWAGLRPLAKDFLPLIGPTFIKGYYLATGYYRSGILLGTYVGDLLARGILSGKMPAELAPFSFKRFQNER